MSTCWPEANGQALRISLLEAGELRAFCELLALPEIADHYFACRRDQVATRVAALGLWSGWSKDGILYVAARDAGGRCLGGAHLTATSIGFFVHPACRRRGLGARLVSACGELAAERGLRTLHAATRPGNVAAQTLLARTGFSRVGGDDAVPSRWHYLREL